MFGLFMLIYLSGFVAISVTMGYLFARYVAAGKILYPDGTYDRIWFQTAWVSLLWPLLTTVYILLLIGKMFSDAQLEYELYERTNETNQELRTKNNEHFADAWRTNTNTNTPNEPTVDIRV
jgi:hypothetical protein